MLICITIETAITIALTLSGVAVAMLAIPPIIAEIRFGKKLSALEGEISQLKKDLIEMQASYQDYKSFISRIEKLEEETSDVRALYRKNMEVVNSAIKKSK